METAHLRAGGWAAAGGDDWVPPDTREGLDAAILELSNDIGLILAQLAEDHEDWCRRTGRDQADHAAWRRRALFAKVHKERQLRECKIARRHLALSSEVASDYAGGVLVSLCRRVLAVWGGGLSDGDRVELDAALAQLAGFLNLHPADATDAELPGRRTEALHP
jgi:hypothetical protein